MSEQHTPGLLRLECGDSGSVAFNEDGTAVFADCPHGGIGKIQGQKNIRRAVACWNLLADVPTKEIEAAANYGSSWGKTGIELAAVTAQRDELLEALKDALKEGIGWFDESCGGDADDLPWVIKARAVIAKVEGGGA